jgi:hypothetical protein
MGRSHDPLARGFGKGMSFDGFRSDSFFGDEFYRGAGEVMEEVPLSEFLSKKISNKQIKMA